MPKIITIAHQKGGVGKSTLALNLAYAFSAKTSTAVIDIDPQGTISRLKGLIAEDGPDIVDLAPGASWSTPYWLSLVPDHKILVIDTPPYNSTQLPGLLAASDIVIIPTKAGIPDVMAIQNTVGFVKDAQRKNKKLQAAIVINMIKPRSALTESVRNQLAKYNIKVVAEIGDRVSYARSILTGGVIAGGDHQAIGEINSLVNEILKMVV